MAQKILGYRELSEEEIRVINNLKTAGKAFGEAIEEMRFHDEYDQRWVSVGKTHIQEGLSALVRAVAKPEGF